MNREQQLDWERLRAPTAAGAAFAAVVLQLASFVIQLPAISDAPSADDPFRYRETLLNFKEHSGVLLGSGIANVLASFAAAGALYYLFVVTRHRRPELPAFVRWLLALAPVFIAVAVIANWVGLNDAADKYTQAGAVATLERSKLTDDERKDVRTFCRSRGPACPAVAIPREETAKNLVEESRGVVGTAAGFAGTLAIAFAYVIISLNAMRAGLLSRFMGVLGIAVGVLIVLPLLPQGPPDRPDVLAGRARAAVPGPLERRPRAGLGDGRGRVLAHGATAAASRPRTLSRSRPRSRRWHAAPRASAGRSANQRNHRCALGTEPSTCANQR